MSYSQNGEDDIIAAQFPPDHKGFVVELGAWDPIDKSNSRLLIERGWDAVLVEFSPLPVEKLVREYGYHDHVSIIQAAVTPNERHVERFNITADALSTDSDTQVGKWHNMRPGYSGGFYGELWVPTISWDRLKDQFFPKRIPDVISVDTEGASAEMGIAILQSNWRPKVLCVEHDNRQVEIMHEAEKHKYKCIHLNCENMILCR